MKPYYEVTSWGAAVRSTFALVASCLVVAAIGVGLAILTDEPAAYTLTVFGVLFAIGQVIRLLLIRKQLNRENGQGR